MGTIRELSPDEEVLPLPTKPPVVRELGADEHVFPQKAMQGQPPIAQFGRGANVGIAEAAGGLVDVVNSILSFVDLDTDEPLGGAQSIRRGLAALGLAPPVGQDDPDSLLGSAGRVTGAATTFLLPVGAAARGASAVVRGIRPPPTSTTGRIVQEVAETALNKPGRFLAGETVSAAAAGTVGFIAREKFPDSEAASFIGELIGGITPAGVVGAFKLLPTVLGARLARSIAKHFTQSGGRRRAARRVQDTARDPQRAEAELADGDILPDADLTPVQLTGDEGLLSLERSIIDSSEQLKGQADEQIAQATQVIRDSLGDLGEGVSPEVTAETLEQARNYILALVETRVRIAARRADELIAELGPNATREEANLIARNEIEKALSAARKQERELFDAIPDDVKVETESVRAAFKSILADTPRAQRDDIPDVARRLLEEGGNERLADLESVKELQGLRSKLLEEGRKARAGGDRNTARISDILADAVLDALGAQRGDVQTEGGAALRAALDFSADLNSRFTRGSIGRLLAKDRSGAPRTPGGLTLETTIGRGGPRAREEARALNRAVERTGDEPALRGAVEEFILNDFQKTAIRDGRIDATKAANFLRRHEETLGDFPELRQRLETAIDADDAAQVAQRRAEGLAERLNDPNVSRAAVFLREPVDAAMARVAKDANPGEVMQELVRQAGRDVTGDALRGLKTAFGEFLLQSVSTRSATASGEFLVSGQALTRLLKAGPAKRMADALLDEAGRKRLKTIIDTAVKVEKAAAAKARPEGAIDDTPSMLFSTIARVAGAQVGRKVALATGGGTVQTPGVLSGIFQKAAKKRVQDPARKLLIDAMNDEALLAALLSEAATPAAKKAVSRKLNAWVAAIVAEEAREEDN